MYNVVDVDDNGHTAWFIRFQEEFDGEFFAFGSGVYFRLANTKYAVGTPEPRLVYGVSWVIVFIPDTDGIGYIMLSILRPL